MTEKETRSTTTENFEKRLPNTLKLSLMVLLQNMHFNMSLGDKKFTRLKKKKKKKN